jgi:hypothetical protein
MYKGKAAYNDVVQTKDMQIAQVRRVASGQQQPDYVPGSAPVCGLHDACVS